MNISDNIMFLKDHGCCIRYDDKACWLDIKELYKIGITVLYDYKNGEYVIIDNLKVLDFDAGKYSLINTQDNLLKIDNTEMTMLNFKEIYTEVVKKLSFNVHSFRYRN